MPANTPRESAKRECVHHGAAEAVAAHQHLGHDGDDEGDGQRHLQAGHDLRQGGRQHDLPQQLAFAGPILRADQSMCRSTPAMPTMVAVTTGKMASSTTMAILEVS